MGGKAKPTKHTAKELAGRAAASMQNKGGGKAGLADRKGGAAVLPSASVGPAVLDATPSLEAPWGGGRRTRFVARLRRVHAVQRRIPQARDAAHALSVQFPHEPPLGVLVVEARGEQVFAGRWHGGWVDGRWEVSTGYVSYSSPTQVEERSATSHLGWGSQ